MTFKDSGLERLVRVLDTKPRAVELLEEGGWEVILYVDARFVFEVLPSEEAHRVIDSGNHWRVARPGSPLTAWVHRNGSVADFSTRLHLALDGEDKCTLDEFIRDVQFLAKVKAEVGS